MTTYSTIATDSGTRTVTINFGEGVEPFVYQFDPAFQRDLYDTIAGDPYTSGTSDVMDSPYTGEEYREYTQRLKLFDSLRKDREMQRIAELRVAEPTETNERELEQLTTKGFDVLPVDLFHRVSLPESEYYKHRFIVTMDEGRTIEPVLERKLMIEKTIARIDKHPNNVVVVHYAHIPSTAELETTFCHGRRAVVLPSSVRMERYLQGSTQSTWEPVFDDYCTDFCCCNASKDPEVRYRLFALTNYTSYLGNHTALRTLTQMIGNAIKKCRTPEEARSLCGLDDDFSPEERQDLKTILKGAVVL